jgi:CMP-N-acetylneuraminic acid synthetase
VSRGGGILGLIPARGGSAGIPRKNLASLAGRPLIAHTIAAALAASRLERVVVSTDDAEIAEAARAAGAEAPFLRPAELAADAAPALMVIRHAVDWLRDREGWRAEAVVYLQPTSPLRPAARIDQAVELLLAGPADTVVSVVEVPHNLVPGSQMRLDDQGMLEPCLDRPGPLRRQEKPRLYARNGPAVLALRPAAWRREALYAGPTLPLVMGRWESLDIDGPEDLELAQWLAREKGLA